MSVKNEEVKMKIIWAYEPFHQERKVVNSMHKMIRYLSGSDADVECVYVTPGNENAFDPAFNMSEDERFNAIKGSLKKAKVSVRDNKIKIIKSSGPCVRRTRRWSSSSVCAKR